MGGKKEAINKLFSSSSAIAMATKVNCGGWENTNRWTDNPLLLMQFKGYILTSLVRS